MDADVVARLDWCVYGNPVPQKRHRHTRQGRVWDPSSAQKRAFLEASREACPTCDVLRGPLRMQLTFVFQRPKSHYTSKGKLTARAPLQHVHTPDADNLAKFVMDSISGVGRFILDDRQVYELSIAKRWGDRGFTRVVIC